MIARVWKGQVRTVDAEAYAGYVERTGVAAHRRTPGNRGSMILRRAEGEETTFVVVSLWDSLDAIRGFAGEDPEVAVFYPEDEAYLLERDSTVTHFEVPVIALDLKGRGPGPP